jgi:glycosyltransferase involved in cell wall biosynthesis
MLLSIIIPCYNSEKYLYSTISSVENEIADCLSCHTLLTSNDFELIVINDGSTDKTSEIIKSLCLKFDNIKVITQSNKGLSASRNVGLKSAKGDYVHFIDSDDMLFAGAYKHLISSILPPHTHLDSKKIAMALTE